MAFVTWLVLIIEILAVLFGIYSEVAPANWPLNTLPQGMGAAIALVSAPMALAVIAIQEERSKRAQEKEFMNSLSRVWGRSSTALPTSEKEFYAIWREQCRVATVGIDVTNLSPRSPRDATAGSEGAYFSELVATYRGTSAKVRRVERLNADRKAWLRRLVQECNGLTHVSIAVYRSTSDAEALPPVSVCRIDDRYAWLVALAEHEATTTYRDVLITGPDCADLLRRYFEDRLWKASELVLDRGVVRDEAFRRLLQ
jgi:hypothetical protein